MPLHRLPIKMAFDTGMLLPASSFRANARNLFRSRSRKDVGERAMGNTVLPANRDHGVSCKLIHA